MKKSCIGLLIAALGVIPATGFAQVKLGAKAEAGATIDECRHAILLATTTIGFPAMMAALSWAEDVSKEEK